MAIEISKKTTIKGPIWLYVLLAVGIVLVLGLGGTYAYFYFQGKNMSQRITEISQKLQKTEEEKALENDLLSKEKKIEDFKKLLSGHKKIINVFNFLQERTHPQVWFSNFNFEGSGGSVSVEAKAKNFEAAGQQLLTLRKESILKTINLSELSTGEQGGVVFSLNLTFDSQIFE